MIWKLSECLELRKINAIFLINGFDINVGNVWNSLRLCTRKPHKQSAKYFFITTMLFYK